MNKIIEKQIGEGWSYHLSSFFESEEFKIITKKLQENKNNYFPSGSNVFKAFELCKWEDIRLIIIDDYALSVSNGLAYGTIEDTLIEPWETKEIMLNIELAYDKFLLNNFDYTMENFAKQGILLLNLELTHIKNKYGTNPVIWETFTKFVIDKLNKEKTGLIWVLWSPNVRSVTSLINNKFHNVISEDIKPEHFIKINNLIEQINGEEFKIKWYE